MRETPRDGFVRLTVEDGGAGVPDEALEHLFEKFYRAPGAAKGSRSGMGIGLAVVHGLVAAMGGQASARRSDLGGPGHRSRSAGRVDAIAERDRIRDMSRSDGSRPGPLVLVVEDDAETRHVVARELSARGYRVEQAPDGRTALERWEDRRPDIVLLDLGLPDIDGLQIIRRIRREASTPIVILSGRYEEREKVAALDRGADDYVTKPFGVDELNARLRVALRHAAGPVADQAGAITVGPLVMDVAQHQTTVAGRTVDLTPGNSSSSGSYSTNSGRIVTKGRLLRAVWGAAYQREDSYVYVHVSQLRRKIAARTRTVCCATSSSRSRGSATG